MKTIKLYQKVGSFAENKDVAKEIRLTDIIPAVQNNKEIVLDFENIDGATQSFVHALISDVIRKFGDDGLDLISFKSCNETVQKIIVIVTEYMQESR